MPVDAEIVAGGVWLKGAGAVTLDAALEACLSATRKEGFVPGGRLLVDARDAVVEGASPEQVAHLVEHGLPRILETMPFPGVLTTKVDLWVMSLEIVRQSRELESVEFFSDLPTALRWLTHTA